MSDWSADMTEKQLHSDLDDEDAMTTSNLLQNCAGSSGVFQESVITDLCHLSIRKILTDPNTPPCHPNTHILFSPSVGVLGSKVVLEGLNVVFHDRRVLCHHPVFLPVLSSILPQKKF